MKLGALLDRLLWRFRLYRRYRMRQRMEFEIVAVDPCTIECDLCGAQRRVLRLTNGGMICTSCREALAYLERTRTEGF